MNKNRKATVLLAGTALMIAAVVAGAFWAFGQIRKEAAARKAGKG